MKLDCKISFDPNGHKYYSENGIELISVTTLLNLYKKPFDQNGNILKKCAIKRGISEIELKKEWEEIGNNARTNGTSIHNSIEYYIKTKKIKNDKNKDIVKNFKKIKFNGFLHSEILIGNERLGIAGTSDILEEYKQGSLNLYDLKTNKKGISTYNCFGDKLLFPLDHLYQTDENIYSLQLSLYSYLLEEVFGFWINNLIILWINSKNQQIKQIPMQNRRGDVIRMLEHYKNNH